MALSNELVRTLISHRGDTMEEITRILNEYNNNQTPYNRLNGEDILTAYKLTGLYRTPTEIICDTYGVWTPIYDDKIGIYRFSNHI